MNNIKTIQTFFSQYKNIIQTGLEYNYSEKEIFNTIYKEEFNNYLRKGIHPRLDELQHVMNFVKQYRDGTLQNKGGTNNGGGNPNHDPQTGRFTSETFNHYSGVKKPKRNGVSTEYGSIDGVHSNRARYPKGHEAIDMPAKTGTPIPSNIDGEVFYIGNNSNGFGNFLVIRDKNNFDHYYGHLHELPKLRIGQKIKKGDMIGLVGNSGHSYGAHLHYEIRSQQTEMINNRHRKIRISPIDEDIQYFVDFFKEYNSQN